MPDQDARSAAKPPCLYPLLDGRRCCECDACQASTAARVYEPPTDEQLVNFAAVMAIGPGATEAQKDTVRALLEHGPVREEWLRRHRQMQEDAWNL